MKLQGITFGVSVMILLVLLTSYSITSQNTISLIGIAVVALIVVVWAVKQFNDKRHYQQELLDTKQKLANINETLDVTKQDLDRTTEAFNNQKIKYQQIFDSLVVNIFSYNLDENSLSVSKQVEKVYGYSREEFAATPSLWKKVIYSEDADIAVSKEKELMKGDSVSYDHRVVRKDNEIIWVEIQATPIKDKEGNVYKINGTVTDITERKILEKKLQQMAYYDELTDLPNRKLLEIHIKKSLARSKRHEHNLTVMFIDLDGFKNVNDTLGHESGDLLLKEVAVRLYETVREEDLIARLGGDEFIVVFEDIDREILNDIAKRLVDTISIPYLLNGETAKVSPSIGISMYPDDGLDKDTLIQHADKAMYYAKSKGKSNFQFYHEELADFQPKKSNVFDRIVETVSKIGIGNKKD